MADMKMTEEHSIKELHALAKRLHDHADHVVNAAARQAEADMRAAAKAATDLAILRVHLREIADKCAATMTEQALLELLELLK